nr:uncharacterized protein At2g34160-like [Ipomoea batatas]GMD99023.1 uncharacterized protein At2g34160-like [Ipomoea batatas]
MEEITEGVTNINISAGDLQKKNRIQVSSTKKPLFFYVNLAKATLCPFIASLMIFLPFFFVAIATVVSVAEILKNNGLAVEKKIMTSTVDVKDDSRGRPISKAKIEIVLGKSEKFDEIMAAAASEKDRGDGEVQS